MNQPENNTQAETQARPPASAGQPTIGDRAFIVSEPLRNVTRNGQRGISLKVRLTSYRSLPLSCIEGIQLSIDGEQFDPASMILTLNGYSHKLAELPSMSKIFWFVLDYADLFVPRAEPLAPGYHDVEGTLITVEPYMTAGRFSFYNPSKKRLLIEAEQAQAQEARS
jgi:hypothetical protein